MNEETDSAAQQEAEISDAVPALTSKRAILILAVFFIAQEVIGFGLSMVVGAYLGLAQLAQGISDSAAITEAYKPFELSVGMLGFFFAAIIAFRMTRKTFGEATNAEGLATIGWQRSSARKISVAALTGCAVSLFSVFVFMPAYPPPDGQQWGPLATAASSGGWPLIQWSFLAFFLAPPIEEFIFRGVLFSGLSKSIGAPVSATIVTLLFLLLHLRETLTYWPALIGIGMLAVITMVFRIRAQSLLPAVAAHAGYNLVLVISALIATA